MRHEYVPLRRVCPIHLKLACRLLEWGHRLMSLQIVRGCECRLFYYFLLRVGRHRSRLLGSHRACGPPSCLYRQLPLKSQSRWVYPLAAMSLMTVLQWPPSHQTSHSAPKVLLLLFQGIVIAPKTKATSLMQQASAGILQGCSLSQLD